MSVDALDDPAWAPQACTLPTAGRPLRLAELDALLATEGLSVQREAVLDALAGRAETGALP